MTERASISGDAKVSIATIAITADDKRLSVRYQIKNGLPCDVWLCESMNVGAPWHFEAFLDQDDQTLLVRRQLDVPMIGSGQPTIGLYRRLLSGQTRTEVLSLTLPVCRRLVLSGGRKARPLLQARRLILRIGWYEGDLPAKLLTAIRQMGSDSHKIRVYTGNPLDFVRINERLRARNDQVMIPWTEGAFKGEKVLEMAMPDLAIPYSEQDHEPAPPQTDFALSLDIKFQQSALEFFFPYPDEQLLLSDDEKRHLLSMDTVPVRNQQLLKGLASELAGGLDDGFFINRGMAQMDFQSDGDRVLSLAAYPGASVVTETGQVFRFHDGMPSMRAVIPEVQRLELRVRCAANLRNLWHRFRVYDVAQHAPRDLKEYWANRYKYGYIIPPKVLAQPERIYPSATRWCDALRQGFAVASGDYKGEWTCPCPSQPTGKCHYAMNPSCKPDSPPDLVLLFETRAGWNQHGSQELFTFDNHDPKGGLVLLNDGTVKFIRTEEELKQLRWK